MNAPPTVAERIVSSLEAMGVRWAFGVSGAAIAPLWTGLEHSTIQVLHFRHEAGAAFAAVESYFATGRPAVIFTTTGPGLTNALTGLFAARAEGAKVILLSPATPAAQRGRWAFQETSAHAMPSAGIFTSGALFHYATTLESAAGVAEAMRRLSLGLTRLEGFVGHLNIPADVQSSPCLEPVLPDVSSRPPTQPDGQTIRQCVQWLKEEPFAIWAGFGARAAADSLLSLAQRTGAPVMCSPRAKGIFPEDHPQFVGVTGFGGHGSVVESMQQHRPQRTLVLGTRLGELTSFWNPALVPPRGFIHVDIDPEVPGTAFPSVETVAIQSDVDVFLRAVLSQLPAREAGAHTGRWVRPRLPADTESATGQIRPEVLMALVQRLIVEGSEALVMAEPGCALAWANHWLRFNQPGRYRVSTAHSSMGHTVTGVVGAALARQGKAITLTGDGAMLMNCEVNTAVKYNAQAVWIVLNDAGYNMCGQGLALAGYKGMDVAIPRADFTLIARGMGADGVRVEKESELPGALQAALAAPGPFVIDVLIDPTRPAPFGARMQSLMAQGVGRSSA